MKSLLIGFMMFFVMNSYAKESLATKCSIVFRPAGIWYNTCPLKTFADGVDVWVSPNPGSMASVRVRCISPEIVCTEVTKESNNK
jgi:hypothetical protein